MSTRSGALQQVRPIGHVWLVAVVAVLLVVGIAVAIAVSRPMDASSSGPVVGARGPHALRQMPKRAVVTDPDIRPHGPNRIPKQGLTEVDASA